VCARARARARARVRALFVHVRMFECVRLCDVCVGLLVRVCLYVCVFMRV